MEGRGKGKEVGRYLIQKGDFVFVFELTQNPGLSNLISQSSDEGSFGGVTHGGKMKGNWINAKVPST